MSTRTYGALAVTLIMLVANMATAVPPGLKESGPITCKGDKDIVLSRRYIKTAGNGVEAHGNCEIKIMGSGSVTAINSTINGRKGAVSIMGSGDVKAKGTTFIGGISKLGTGRFVDQGGNTKK